MVVVGGMMLGLNENTREILVGGDGERELVLTLALLCETVSEKKQRPHEFLGQFLVV